MVLTYKILFEVKLMHEYYLTRSDGEMVFEHPLQADRLAFLQKELLDERDAVNEDISFRFPGALSTQYESSGLKIIPSYSGCKVVVRVIPRTLPDQSVVYDPAVELPDDLQVLLLLVTRGNNIDSVTNRKIWNAYRAVYYFSNDEVRGGKTFPFLTNNIPGYDPAYPYEQGELAITSGGLQAYYTDGVADKWLDVAGTNFANETDRILLPSRFTYSFDNAVNLTEAVFTLTGKDGNIVDTKTYNNADGLPKNMAVGFSAPIHDLSGAPVIPHSDLVYTLKVSGDNGYERNHTIVFATSLLEEHPWAVINILGSATDPQYNLFGSDGYLIARQHGAGGADSAPVFEIPVKSRVAFWRFINNKGLPLDVAPGLTDYLDKEDNVLVTKRPASLSRDFFLLRKEGSTDTAYVPNPVSIELIPEKTKRISYDVRVAESELFPTTP